MAEQIQVEAQQEMLRLQVSGLAHVVSEDEVIAKLLSIKKTTNKQERVKFEALIRQIYKSLPHAKQD